MRDWGRPVLAVGVEAVDAKLDFGEDATDGVQLANFNGRLYHFRSVEVYWVSGAV